MTLRRRAEGREQLLLKRPPFEWAHTALGEEELERPVPGSTWQVKDFVSHLGTLDTLLTRQFQSFASGNPETLGQNANGTPFDLDRWNDAEVEKRRGWTLEQMLEEASENRKAFLEALSRLTDEQIEQTMRFTGDNKRDPADIPFKLFLYGLARHDPIHVADMVKALPERAGDPELQAWLDHPAVTWYQNAMAGPAKREWVVISDSWSGRLWDERGSWSRS